VRRGRPRVAAALLAAALIAAVVAAGPASADDITPAPTPTQASSPSISPPSQQQIDDAKSALNRLRNQNAKTSGPTLAQVAGPTAESEGRSVTSRISDEAWWIIGAGALVLLVASETTRVSVRRAKHRKQA
jgi:hypothetical protein